MSLSWALSYTLHECQPLEPGRSDGIGVSDFFHHIITPSGTILHPDPGHCLLIVLSLVCSGVPRLAIQRLHGFFSRYPTPSRSLHRDFQQGPADTQIAAPSDLNLFDYNLCYLSGKQPHSK